MSTRDLIKGTMILTLAGIATRIIGFFYRIYLSNLCGPCNLGVYQLVFPIYGICHTIYSVGITTSLSKTVAECVHMNNSKKIAGKYFVQSLIISVSVALILSTILYANASFVANRFLVESKTEPLLKYITISFPLSACTSCINGYYYGLKKTTIPAISLLVEQSSRFIFVALMSILITSSSMDCKIAVYGLVAGDFFSFLISIILSDISAAPHVNKSYMAKILNPAIPLTMNKLLVSILGTIESSLIPIMLRKNGLSNEHALAIYGILTGMSMPFIMFPSTIAGSFSLMLLPEISEANSKNNMEHIKLTIIRVIKLSITIGGICSAIFFLFGNELGLIVFNNITAGNNIRTLSFICPFIYISTTFSSILNGLGKSITVFVNSCIGLTIRIFLLILLMPLKGIAGYLYALLISQSIITALDLIYVIRFTKTSLSPKILIIPCLLTAISSLPIKALYNLIVGAFPTTNRLYNAFLLMGSCLLITVIYTSGTVYLNKKSYYN